MSGEVSEREQFRTFVEGVQHEAESALVRGDVGPRLDMWSHHDPVTLFAAVGPTKAGWADLEPTFRLVIRLTHSYRREGGTWKVVHEHSDFQPPDHETPPPIDSR
jgi:hypothetical protein